MEKKCGNERFINLCRRVVLISNRSSRENVELLIINPISELFLLTFCSLIA